MVLDQNASCTQQKNGEVHYVSYAVKAVCEVTNSRQSQVRGLPQVVIIQGISQGALSRRVINLSSRLSLRYSSISHVYLLDRCRLLAPTGHPGNLSENL